MEHFFDIILLIGVIQGFILSAALWVKNLGKPKQNYYFLALIGIITLAILAKLLFNADRYHAYPHFWFFVDLAAYSVGPLWYLTLVKSVNSKVILTQQEWLLLAPMLFHLGFLVYISFLSRETLISSARLYWFDWCFYGFCLTVLIVNGGFILKSNRLLKQYRDAQFPDLLIKGQQFLLLVIAFWLVSFILSFTISSKYNLNLNTYHYAFITLAFLTFGLAFLALVRPASFYFLTQTFNSSETYALQQIAEHILNFLNEEAPFLNRNFSLQDLSVKIKSNPVLTSKAINRILKTNFNDLINKHRVEYFVKLAKEEHNKNLTLWAIAQEAGFGNKATFYKAFKKNMGATPKSYLSSV
ncbi:MAG: helix-turn-helix domain-containing protein [Chitinophagales bacterium]|nr:helix-turn-helix domain-containing protein [Chitinophagales bacterium]